MSSQGSPTPSIDSDVDGISADLAALNTHDSHNEFVDIILFQQMGLDMSFSRKPVPGEDYAEWKHVDYRGTLTRLLASFGVFRTEPETKKFPWISDNTSGAVHPDMPTISMLYNEDLTLPKGAEDFIEQSLALKEEARWERVKAVFYSFYPKDLKKQVFEVLSDMLPREASRIISKKTLRFENEIILISKPKISEPWDDSDSEAESESESDLNAEEGCSREDAAKLNEELLDIAREHKESLISSFENMKTTCQKLAKYGCFKNTEVAQTMPHFSSSFGNTQSPSHDGIFAGSKSWSDEIKVLQNSTKKCVESRLLFHFFDHAVARYEPRTGWIHVKTQLLRRNLKKNKLLPNEDFRTKLLPEYKIEGSPEAQNAAIKRQMEHFEQGLRVHAKGHLLEFDFHHNDPGFYLCHMRVPYENISPDYCGTVLERHLSANDSYCIMSRPQILGYGVLHHEMKVYIKIKKGILPWDVSVTYQSTLEYVDAFGCCLNCFSKDHLQWKCALPEFGFACVSKP